MKTSSQIALMVSGILVFGGIVALVGFMMTHPPVAQAPEHVWTAEITKTPTPEAPLWREPTTAELKVHEKETAAKFKLAQRGKYAYVPYTPTPYRPPTPTPVPPPPTPTPVYVPPTPTPTPYVAPTPLPTPTPAPPGPSPTATPLPGPGPGALLQPPFAVTMTIRNAPAGAYVVLSITAPDNSKSSQSIIYIGSQTLWTQGVSYVGYPSGSALKLQLKDPAGNVVSTSTTTIP